MRGIGVAAVAAGLGGVGYQLLASGKLSLDTGIGRRRQTLGPLTILIAAPREIVFDVIAAPYLERTPRAIAAEIEVLERGADMVLAAHRTAVGWGMVTTTVETVRFERPESVAFRLVKGPVPEVVERFTLVDNADSTSLEYHGELGTDFGEIGRRWGNLVATKWVGTVSASLARIAQEAERRASQRQSL
jgi:hypothetical protein